MRTVALRLAAQRPSARRLPKEVEAGAEEVEVVGGVRLLLLLLGV